MIFWRTHWAWCCNWEEWGNRYPDLWSWRTTHFGDYDTAFDKYEELRKLPPGKVRNISINRRAVGAPKNWLKSS